MKGGPKLNWFFTHHHYLMWLRHLMPSNKALRILLLTDSVILIAGATIGPIYALFVEKVGGDLLDASFAGGVFAVAAGITVILSGRYSDKIKRPELVVVLGYTVLGIGYLLYILVNSIWFLLVVQVIIGFGQAIYNPPYDALYSRHLDDGREGSEWGLWESTNYFSVAVGAIIGGVIVTTVGFNALFMLMAIMCFLSAAYIYQLPKRIL